MSKGKTITKDTDVTVGTTPEYLMPDSCHQYLMPGHPQPDDDWMAYDAWDMETAVKLITIGYPVDLDSMAEEAKAWPVDAWGRDNLGAVITVYSRAWRIAASSIAMGNINAPDTPANWIAWAQSKGYSVEHLTRCLANSTAPAAEELTAATGGSANAASDEGETIETSEGTDERLAGLFDAVGTEHLEKMFPADGKWGLWADKAAREGLRDAARDGRAKFNPYRAAQWWIRNKNPSGWDWARCCRVLANNLPGRSIDYRSLLTGGFE